MSVFWTPCLLSALHSLRNIYSDHRCSVLHKLNVKLIKPASEKDQNTESRAEGSSFKQIYFISYKQTAALLNKGMLVKNKLDYDDGLRSVVFLFFHSKGFYSETY
ncbi:hypothetical protein ILYODFUR_036555 [Ilyodon furcidens]|uniref:Uncharacterized protein n=1 Tax=Ilyodon furcidens TaxID=33524 RepID=A0ABV0UZF0_9TELE